VGWRVIDCGAKDVEMDVELLVAGRGGNPVYSLPEVTLAIGKGVDPTVATPRRNGNEEPSRDE